MLPGTPYLVITGTRRSILGPRTKVLEHQKSWHAVRYTEVILFTRYQASDCKRKISLLPFSFFCRPTMETVLLLISLSCHRLFVFLIQLDTRLRPNLLIVVFVPHGLICFLLCITLLNEIFIVFSLQLTYVPISFPFATSALPHQLITGSFLCAACCRRIIVFLLQLSRHGSSLG